MILTEEEYIRKYTQLKPLEDKTKVFKTQGFAGPITWCVLHKGAYYRRSTWKDAITLANVLVGQFNF